MAPHTNDAEAEQTETERQIYRGRGDTCVEHRPEDDAVLITDGGEDQELCTDCELRPVMSNAVGDHVRGLCPRCADTRHREAEDDYKRRTVTDSGSSR